MNKNPSQATQALKIKTAEKTFFYQNKIREILGEFGIDENGQRNGCTKCKTGNWCKKSPSRSPTSTLTCLSYREIATTLTTLGIKTRTGKDTWSITQVKREVERFAKAPEQTGPLDDFFD